MNALLPVIPEYITVHLGAPDSPADNITVGFADYIKNVASSEIYPTWPEAALRANIYAQISFALNRIYTEYYRSRGYDFDITNSTAYDQSFVAGRDIFDNISEIVDEIFNSYIVRSGFVEPLFAVYCNGTTTTCNGLSQWGSVALANQGLVPYDILANYYGDISLVENAPVAELQSFSPSVPLREGSIGNEVRFVQIRLNRISSNYPLIPKISVVDGIYGVETTDAVRQFQRIFGLDPTGMVNQATWYKIQTIYNAVKRLNDIGSEGVELDEVTNQFAETLTPGESGIGVQTVQYYLKTIALFYPEVPNVEVTGFFGEETENAVRSFQNVFGLKETGVVDFLTWEYMFDAYYGIVQSITDDQLGASSVPFPGIYLKYGSRGEYVLVLQKYLNSASVIYERIPEIAEDGIFGTETRDAVYTAQAVFGLPISGVVGPVLWNELSSIYEDISGDVRASSQFGGELRYEE